MRSLLIKHMIYPLLQRWRGEGVYRHLGQLQKTQWLAPDVVKQAQWNALTTLLDVVYKNNNYYRRRLEDAGTGADDITTYDGFLNIPILEKEELRKDARKMIGAFGNDVIDSRKTSGSTGIPLELFKSRNMAGRIRAIFHRYYRWYGIDIGDKQARLFGHPVSLSAKLKEDIQDIFLNKYRLDPVFLTEKNMFCFYRQLQRIRPDYFYGYPSALYEFSKFLKENSIDAGKLNVKALIATGETLYDFQKQYIEEVFGSRVVNEYGCSECGIIAFQCPQGRMHLSDDNLFIEIIKDNRPAGPGEVGEIVITELYNYSVPLIRYRVGDLAKVATSTVCSCGRGLSCIDSIEGRTSQFIELPGGRKVHTELFHYIADELSTSNGAIKQFRVIQHHGLAFTIEYVSALSDTQQAIDYMAYKLKEFLGKEIQLHFKECASIPRDKNGKLRYFIAQ